MPFGRRLAEVWVDGRWEANVIHSLLREKAQTGFCQKRKTRMIDIRAFVVMVAPYIKFGFCLFCLLLAAHNRVTSD